MPIPPQPSDSLLNRISVSFDAGYLDPSPLSSQLGPDDSASNIGAPSELTARTVVPEDSTSQVNFNGHNISRPPPSAIGPMVHIPQGLIGPTPTTPLVNVSTPDHSVQGPPGGNAVDDDGDTVIGEAGNVPASNAISHRPNEISRTPTPYPMGNPGVHGGTGVSAFHPQAFINPLTNPPTRHFMADLEDRARLMEMIMTQASGPTGPHSATSDLTNSFASGLTIVSSTLPDHGLVFVEPATQPRPPAHAFDFPCSQVSLVDAANVKQAALALNKYEQSMLVYIALVGRLDRMVFLEDQIAIHLNKQLVPIVVLAERLKLFLQKIMAGRIGTGEDMVALAHELDWAEWLYDAAIRGVLHKKGMGCDCPEHYPELDVDGTGAAGGEVGSGDAMVG